MKKDDQEEQEQDKAPLAIEAPPTHETLAIDYHPDLSSRQVQSPAVLHLPKRNLRVFSVIQPSVLTSTRTHREGQVERWYLSNAHQSHK